jgi:hypothetical protein
LQVGQLMTEVELSLVDMKVRISSSTYNVIEVIKEAERLLDKLIVKRLKMLDDIATEADKFK